MYRFLFGPVSEYVTKGLRAVIRSVSRQTIAPSVHFMSTPQEVQELRDEIARLRAAGQPPLPDPAEILRQEYSATAYRLTGLTPTGHHTTYTFDHPRDLPHYARNPVARPAGVFGTEFFRFDTTPTGLSYKEALNCKSGYWAEAEAWAPIVSGLFDSVASLLLILGAADCPAEVRTVLKGTAHSFTNVLDLATLRWHYHQLRATQGAATAQAFHTHQRLKLFAESYLPPAATEFDILLAGKLADKQAKGLASSSTVASKPPK